MRVFRSETASTQTSPPRPPLPPLGPPNSTYFSRRKLRQPLPPSPDFRKTRASSRNFMVPRSGSGALGAPTSASAFYRGLTVGKKPARPHARAGSPFFAPYSAASAAGAGAASAG